MWTSCIEEKLRERNTNKPPDQLENIKQFLDEITVMELRPVEVTCGHTKKAKTVELYKLKPEYAATISMITTGFNHEVLDNFLGLLRRVML